MVRFLTIPERGAAKRRAIPRLETTHFAVSARQNCKIPGEEATLSRQLQINARDYWILSEPAGEGWKAWVLDATAGRGEDVGIIATAETRGAADAAAERKLRRLLGLRPFES